MAFDLSILAQPLAHKSNPSDFNNLTNTILDVRQDDRRDKIADSQIGRTDKANEFTDLQISQAKQSLKDAGKERTSKEYSHFLLKIDAAIKGGRGVDARNMFLDRVAGLAEQRKTDPSLNSDHTEGLLFQFENDPDGFAQSLSSELQIGERMGHFKALGEGVQLQQAKGEGLEGFVFNPATGAFSVNPVMLEMLQKNAVELAETEGLLDPNQVAGVNNKVTTLLKDTNDIREAASTLDTLESRSTPASKIGAIFKFMKALDPTSTVRESEGRMILEAEGAMKGYAQRVNEMMGEGPLSETNFRDLVDTAKTMANGSIDSVTNTISGYLGVLDDKITPEDMQQMQSRVPQRFEISAGSGAKGDEYPEGTIITNGAGDKKILQGGRWVPVE